MREHPLPAPRAAAIAKRGGSDSLPRVFGGGSRQPAGSVLGLTPRAAHLGERTGQSVYLYKGVWRGFCGSPQALFSGPRRGRLILVSGLDSPLHLFFDPYFDPSLLYRYGEMRLARFSYFPQTKLFSRSSPAATRMGRRWARVGGGTFSQGCPQLRPVPLCRRSRYGAASAAIGRAAGRPRLLS